MSCRNVMIILVDSRTNEAVEIQKILTENERKIKTRSGIHDTSEDAYSNHGIIIFIS